MSLDRHEVQSALTMIRDAACILIVTHIDPDGDAIGSLLGLGGLLEAQGKRVVLACEDPVPELYRWLPGSDRVVCHTDPACDLLISLDCGDTRRMGEVAQNLALSSGASLRLLNIDHHVTNRRFGTVNLVDPSSVATAQMVLELADTAGWELTQPVAVCLLTGLVTDTRSFRTANVDATALHAGMRLVEAGASLADTAHRVLDRRSLATVRLWSEALDGLQLQDGILWTKITDAMCRRWALDGDGSSGLANFLSGVREAQVVVVLTERDDGTIDVGMRASPDCDVAQVAQDLGGGGHPQASGCTMTGTMDQVEEIVLAAVRRSVVAQRRNVQCGDAQPATLS